MGPGPWLRKNDLYGYAGSEIIVKNVTNNYTYTHKIQDIVAKKVLECMRCGFLYYNMIELSNITRARELF